MLIVRVGDFWLGDCCDDNNDRFMGDRAVGERRTGSSSTGVFSFKE